MLYQDSVRASYKAIFRGALRGATTPLSLDTLVRRHSLQLEIAIGCFEEVIAEDPYLSGEVERSRKGDRQQVWVPSFYKNATEGWLISFYNSNGFLAYSSLEKPGLNRAKLKFNPEKPPVALDSFFVSPSLIAMIDGEILAALHAGQPIELGAVIHFSTSLTARDIALLISHCSALQEALAEKPLPSAFLFDDAYVVPLSFLDLVLDDYEKYAASHPKSIPSVSLTDSSARQRRQAALLSECRKCLAQWFPEVFPSESHPLAMSISDHLRPELDRIRAKLDKALLTESVGQQLSVRERGKMFQDKFDYIHLNLVFFSLCLGDAALAKGTKKELDEYLCASLGGDLLDHLVTQLASEASVELAQPASQGARDAVVGHLPRELRRAVRGLTLACGNVSCLFSFSLNRFAHGFAIRGRLVFWLS